MFKLDRDDICEAIKELIHKNPEKNPLFESLDLHEKIFIEKTNLNEIYDFRLSPLGTKLEYIRDDETGEIIDYEEVSTELNQKQLDDNQKNFFERPTNANSLSLQRMPAIDKSVRGNSRFFPFKPANIKYKMDRELFFENLKSTENINKNKVSEDILDFDNFLDKPKNFKTGLFNNQFNENTKQLFTFSNDINQELHDDIFEFKKSLGTKVIKNDNIAKEKKTKAAVVNISIKETKDFNYYDTNFVKILDTEEPIDDFDKLLPNPAKVFPFELDTFQKKAILCLEKKQNILVAAHTSAGKTVVAEYAISLSFRNCTRSVYTSPIKALSNQKYRDFRLSYGSDNVGLLTGDIQLNQEATCLIMTTEILLQMLYNGSEIIRDLEWVIFDEVHYINDKDRGHIWEEIFILLPDHINLVLLSATVSNVNEFGDWLGKARNKVTYIVYTKKRPVPLEHFLYLGSDGKTEQFYKIIDEFEKFDTIEYRKAMNFYKEREIKRTSGQQRNKQKSGAAGAKLKTLKPKDLTKNVVDPTVKNMYIAMIRHLQKNEKLPLIVFMFSRQKCNESVAVFRQAMDLCKSKEKARIHMFINNSLQKLKKSDRDLPQVIEVCGMLKNGFGIHHSGILPLLREITEILFQQGLVKVLFATETFAMGVNMPAKSVAFDTLEKHDGTKKRELLPSEYIQMAGRAGRRGKDKTGTVIIICKNEVPDFTTLAKSISNKVSPLESKFRLTYSMILNILRVRHHLRIESMMEKSFIEHKIQLKFQNWLMDKKNLELELKRIQLPDCSLCKIDLDQFSSNLIDYDQQKKQIMVQFTEKAITSKRLIETGSIILFGTIEKPFYIGVVLKFRPSPIVSNTELRIIGFNAIEMINHLGKIDKVESFIDSISLDKIDCITKLVLSDLKVPSDNNPYESEEAKIICENVYEYLVSLSHELPINSIESLFFIPSYCPKDIKLTEMNFTISYNNFLSFRANLLSNQCLGCLDFYNHYKLSSHKVNLEKCLEDISKNLSCENLQFLPDYRKRLQILHELGYINSENVLTMKGKVACLISENELVITDLLVENFLQDLSPEEIAAIMSSLMFQQKHDLKKIDNPNLAAKIIDIRRVAIHLDSIQQKYGLNMNSSEILDSLNFGLVEIVYNWAKGMPFSQLMQLTNIQEGIIVRCIQRTDELLKDLVAAAKLIGDIELANKISESSKCIRRDIVFSVSLYVQDGLNFKNK